MSDANEIRNEDQIEKKPFFSIVIPIYNASEYLEECLQSILAQDFQDWEAILVDDCSTDNSLGIAKKYSLIDTRIKVYESTKNSGCAYIPRVRAAQLANAKYIVSIDADDIVSADLLRIHHKYITTHGSDLVIPEMWRLKGKQTEKKLPLDSIDVSKSRDGKDLVKHTLCRWEIPMCGFGIKRDLYLNATKNISDRDLKSIFSDELLSRWILFMSRNVYFSKSRYYYRENETSVTHINLPRYIDSRMITCDGLISMTSRAFGEDSATHIRAKEYKFYMAVDLLRMINKSNLGNKQKKASIRIISSAMKKFDISKLIGRVSSRYLALMSLPIPLARLSLKIIDPLFKK